MNQQKILEILRNCLPVYVFTYLMLLCSTGFCQWYDVSKINKRAVAALENSRSDIEMGQYQNALTQIRNAIQIDHKYIDAYISLGGIFSRMKRYDSAVHYYRNAIDMDTVYCKEQYLPYSIALSANAQFDKALQAIDIYLSKKDLRENGQKAGNLRREQFIWRLNNQKSFEHSTTASSTILLKGSVNTILHEYFPSMPVNENKLIFNRRVGPSDEDFMESQLTDTGWTNATPLQGFINSDFSEGAGTISQDGKYLYYTGCNYPQGKGSCDLYVSKRNNDGTWNAGKNLGANINTDFWESTPSLSPDNQTLYFSSNKPGGYGGKDIWISYKSASGYWGTPVNAGSIINTSGDETAPFIHADNKHLYFVSNGHPGYGNGDLFVSMHDTGNTWSDPINLGYPINTADDEGALTIAPDGETAYFSSDRYSKTHSLDIYSVKLRNEIKPIKSTGINGSIKDAITSLGLPSNIELTQLTNRTVHEKVVSDEQGHFFMTLSKGETYLITVQTKGYLFYSSRLTVDDSLKKDSLVILLNPIRKGAVISLKNILFERNAYEIQSGLQPELDKLVNLLNENPQINASIIGHTDNTGTKSANLTLSKNRANAVLTYLVEKGINKSRLKAKGVGDTQPADKNTNEEGKNNNRRTEIHLNF